MTSDEYRARYAASQGLTPAEAAALRIVECRCSIGGNACPGWTVDWSKADEWKEVT